MIRFVKVSYYLQYIYFDNKAKPVLSTVVSLLLNSVTVRLLLKYLISLFPNCQNFPSQFCHFSTASLLCIYTSLHTALTSKTALTCIHSPYNAMLVPIALVLPRFNSTQLKFCHFVHYFQRQVVLAVALASISIQSICASKPSQTDCGLQEGIPPCLRIAGTYYFTIGLIGLQTESLDYITRSQLYQLSLKKNCFPCVVHLQNDK